MIFNRITVKLNKDGKSELFIQGRTADYKPFGAHLVGIDRSNCEAAFGRVVKQLEVGAKEPDLLNYVFTDESLEA
jgi:hypothetical protein